MSLFNRIARPSTMIGYNFTERTRRVLQLSREAAGRLHHEYVGTEHILLGLIAEGQGVASAVIQNLGADPDALRTTIEDTVKAGKAAQQTGPDLPYTSRAKKTLELAMHEARELNHSYVGTEHLLLGLIAEGKGIAAQVLLDAGVTLDAARAEARRLLGNELPASPRLHVVPDAAAHGTTRHDEPTPAALEQEEAAWRRLGHALDVGARLGVPPSLALEDDGSLTVSVGPSLVISVMFPPHVRLRRSDAPPNG